jgi:ATP-dependent protease ClpP protease subunit
MLSFLVSLLVSFSAQAKNIELTSYNHCTVATQVDFESMQAAKLCLAKQIAKRKFTDYPLYLVLDTPGGSILEGLRFIEWAKTVPNLHTVSIYAASMGAFTMQALPGKRYVLETSFVMFHRARGTFKGQFEGGELETQLILWKKIVRGMEQTSANRIGISLKSYKQKVVNEWWLYGRDSIKAGVADEVVTVTCSAALMAETKTETLEGFFGPIEVTTSACPMFN